MNESTQLLAVLIVAILIYLLFREFRKKEDKPLQDVKQYHRDRHIVQPVVQPVYLSSVGPYARPMRGWGGHRRW